MKINDDVIQYERELIKVLNENNLAAFRRFWERWEIANPSNEEVRLTTYKKLQVNTFGCKPSIKKQATKWLLERGYSPRIF